MLIKSKCIFDSIHNEPFEGYVLTDGERIKAIGQGNPPEEITVAADCLCDVGDRTVIPGFCDNHVHIFFAALDIATCNLAYTPSEEAAAEKLYEFYKNRDDEWITGFGWCHYDWPDFRLPSRHSLDRYFPDRPVVLVNDELHALWVNTEAMRRCGVDRDTADPPNSMIAREEDGTPSGYILEQNAMRLFMDKAMDYDMDKVKELIAGFIKHAHSKGVTSVGDMEIASVLKSDAYREMQKDGQFRLRAFFSPSIWKSLEEFLELKKEFDSDNLSLLGAKGFIDGTPLGHTGLMVDEYCDLPGEKGAPVVDLEEMRQKIILLNENGIPVRLHACGDGAVRAGLDFIEEARQKHDCRLRNTIEHIEVIAPSDIGRFVETGTVASIQPNHMTMESIEEHPAFEILGEDRIEFAWISKTLTDAGAVVALGTDCPIVPLEPLETLHRAVNRVMEDGSPEGGWNVKEKLTLSEAIKGATINGAYLYGMENKIGTLEPGKYADIVVLDENIFNSDPLELIDIEVYMTLWNGEKVYKKGENNE